MKRASWVPVVMMWSRVLGRRLGMRVIMTGNGMPESVAEAVRSQVFLFTTFGSLTTHAEAKADPNGSRFRCERRTTAGLLVWFC
jgi:hypothetical protein